MNSFSSVVSFNLNDLLKVRAFSANSYTYYCLIYLKAIGRISGASLKVDLTKCFVILAHFEQFMMVCLPYSRSRSTGEYDPI